MVVLLISICCVYRIQIAKNDTDPLWHYKLGEEIVKTGRVSMENHFTWQKGTIWNQQEWLFDLILYLVVHRFGFAGYQVMLIIDHCIGFFICYRICRPSERLEKAVFLCAFLFLCVANQNNRPACYSVYLLMIWMDMYDRKMSLPKRAVCSALPGLFIANFHGGNVSIMILLYLFCMAVECILWIREKKHIQKKRLRDLFISLLCFSGAACICPMGWKVLINTFTSLGSETIRYIDEWNHLPLTTIQSCLILFVALLSGIYVHASGYEHKAAGRILYTLCFTAAGIVQRRGFITALYFWLCFCLPYTIRALYFLLDIPAPEEPDVTVNMKKDVLRWVSGYISAVLVLILFLHIGGYPTFDEYADQSWAEETLAYIEKHYNSDTRILAPYASNSVLMYHDIPVTVDPREYPYDSDTNHSLMDVITIYSSKDREEVSDLLDQYGFDYIVTDDDSVLEWYLDGDSGYRKVTEGVSRTGVHQALYEKE